MTIPKHGFLLTCCYLGTFYEKLIMKCFKKTFFLKKGLLQKTKFFMKPCPIRTKFETTIRKSINHSKIVYRQQKNFKIVVHLSLFLCRLPLNSCYNFSFLLKKHVWMTNTNVITKFREVFCRFKENKGHWNLEHCSSHLTS